MQESELLDKPREFLRRCKHWYLFSRRVWGAIILGWLSVALGLTGSLAWLPLENSGALLVCAAIVAEVFHVKRNQIFIDAMVPGTKTAAVFNEVTHTIDGRDYLTLEVTSHSYSFGKHTTTVTEHWPLYHLYKLALEAEFVIEDEDRRWLPTQTIERFESRVEWSIVITAVSGTLLWAFAPYLYSTG